MATPLPPQSVLVTLLNYDPNTGWFTYRKRPNFRLKPGRRAGTAKPSGYRYLKINGTLYAESRLAWMYVYGKDPGDLTVDHIDRDPSNNAIANLRLATASQQSFNRAAMNGTGLPRGVCLNPRTGKYIATLNFRVAGVRINKTFDTAQEASAFYEKHRAKHGGAFAQPFPAKRPHYE